MKILSKNKSLFYNNCFNDYLIIIIINDNILWWVGSLTIVVDYSDLKN